MMNCYCGGMKDQHHVGDSGCFREEVKVKPRKVSGSEDRWVIDGISITGYTLREQRLYQEHPDGLWSRPKGGVSENSLPDET